MGTESTVGALKHQGKRGRCSNLLLWLQRIEPSLRSMDEARELTCRFEAEREGRKVAKCWASGISAAPLL